jgi:hypothetical protein
VESVDTKRNRIQLTMIPAEEQWLT